MKFGISTFVTDDGISPTVLGKALEERGFDALLLAEHSHIPLSRETPYPGGGELPPQYYGTLDPFVALAAIAAVTENLLLGTGVALLIQRDVIHTANEVASLDLISGGRVLFGVGAGWNREEMRNHGTDPRTRGALLNEQLQALKVLWTEDAPEFHGEFVDFDPVVLRPKPVRRPHPPIYVGGASEAALNRLVDHADGWMPIGGTPPERIAEVVRSLAERGKPDVPVTMFGGPTDSAGIDAMAEAGVERIAFSLATAPEAETLRQLDELATVVNRHR